MDEFRSEDHARLLPALPRLLGQESQVTGGVDPHLVALCSPENFEAEPYRVLSHLVTHMRQEAGLRVMAISSPSMGDGKTSTAINLVGVLAQASSLRVLLLEAELRRPSIATYLGIRSRRRRGLVEALLDPTISLEDIVQPYRAFNFSVLLAGRSLATPFDLLRLPRFGELLAMARKYYDLVIVDTPPLVPFADCRLIEKWIDGFLVIVTAHKTPRRLVEEALQTIDPAKLIGLVFNKDDYQSPRYYDAYRYYT